MACARAARSSRPPDHSKLGLMSVRASPKSSSTEVQFNRTSTAPLAMRTYAGGSLRPCEVADASRDAWSMAQLAAPIAPVRHANANSCAGRARCQRLLSGAMIRCAARWAMDPRKTKKSSSSHQCRSCARGQSAYAMNCSKYWA